MAETVLAQKGKFRKKFPIETWDLLGKDKNGWTIVDENNEVVSNNVTPPNSGEKKKVSKKQIVENLVAEKKSEEVVINEVKLDSTEEPKNQDNKSAEFVQLATKELTIARIKDFFDAKEIQYKNSMKLDELVGLLAVNLNNDIEALKAQFNLGGTEL